jgi:nicotinamide phosphoribosyltransferase
VVLLLSDCYNHEHCVKEIIGKQLRDEIRAFPGLVGIRPDSGDIVEVTADTTEWLMDAFGYETNSKGFRVLPPFVRVVQGDGVTIDSLPRVYTEMKRRGLSAENALFGMGGGLLQHHNRDTLNFGQKASAVCVNGEWRDIFKAPTGASFKVSKRGRLALKYENGSYVTVARDSIPPEENVLAPVFRNGKLLKKWDFAELIARSERPCPEAYYADAVRALRAGPSGAEPR